MTALIKNCNKFPKFVNNTEQKRNVYIHTHARAHSYMHKYSDERFTYAHRDIAIRKYLYIVSNV